MTTCKCGVPLSSNNACGMTSFDGELGLPSVTYVMYPRMLTALSFISTTEKLEKDESPGDSHKKRSEMRAHRLSSGTGFEYSGLT